MCRFDGLIALNQSSGSHRLDGEPIVREDAYLRSDRHCRSHDVCRGHRRMSHERLRRSRRIRRARADGGDAVVRFDDVAFARQDQERLPVADDQLRLEAAQIAIGAPFLGQLDGGLAQIPVVGLELRFELGEEGQGCLLYTSDAADE